MRISDWSSDVCSSDLLVCSTGLADSERNTKDRIGAELGLVLGAVELDHELVDLELLRHVLANDGRRKVRNDVLDGFGHALAEEIGRASCRERVCQYV